MNDDQVPTAARTRKPWLAGLVSLFVTALGQIYNGQKDFP